MRAMTITKFGSIEHMQLADVDVPAMGPRDMTVAVHASALNPVDTKLRQGLGIYGDLPLPLVPGYDLSGIVEAVGPEVTTFKPGDAVYASPSLARWGAHAEKVVIDARSAAAKPASLSHEEAAALPLVTLTAWESLHGRAGIRPGETVFIHAGAGGVGHVAVQIAKHHGCRVITTASRPESIALCEQLGADVVVNYREQDVVEAVMAETGGAGVPVAFDTVGGAALDQCMQMIAFNGRVVGIVHTQTDQVFPKLFRKNATLHCEFMGVPTFYNLDPAKHGEMLTEATKLVDAGALRPHIHKTVDLADLPAAHDEQEGGHVMGKIVVVPSTTG